MKKYFIVILLLLLLIPALSNADLGPKPSMEFYFKSVPIGVSIIKGEMFECTDSECKNKSPFREMGPQTFICNTPESGPGCFSMSYGYEPYHQIVITFSDKVRESNIFSSEGMESYYKVDVRKNDLEVKESGLEITGKNIDTTQNKFIEEFSKSDINIDYQLILIFSLVLTIILEVVVVILYGLMKKILPNHQYNYPNKLIIWVSLINLISLPLFWLLARYITFDFRLFTIIAEIIIIFFEAWFIIKVTHQESMRKEIFLLSLVMNTVSFFVGNVIGNFLIG